jgi:hypothetical protein
MNIIVQGHLDQTSKILESSYNLLKETETSSDIESAVKNKMLIRIKNLLVENVIILDMVSEINENPGDVATLEAILELISDSQELLS